MPGPCKNEYSVPDRAKKFMVRRGSLWCGVAQLVARQRKAGPSSILGSAPHVTGRFFPLSCQAMRRWRKAPANGDG